MSMLSATQQQATKEVANRELIKASGHNVNYRRDGLQPVTNTSEVPFV